MYYVYVVIKNLSSLIFDWLLLGIGSQFLLSLTDRSSTYLYGED